MSEPTPRPPSPAHPTRQQLDELDALMQRMLALPVSQQSEGGEAAPTADSGAEIAFAENADSRLPNTWEGDPVPTVSSAAVSAPERETPEQAAPPVPVHHPVVAPRMRKAAEARPRPPRRGAAWLLAPLVLTNRGFDRCAARLGAPGRWLGSAAGRNVLGWLGVVCLIAAVAWVVIELNWTW